MPEFDAALEKPRDRFHDMMNAINQGVVAGALVRKELEHQGLGITRVELLISSLVLKVEAIAERANRFESDVTHKIDSLETKVVKLEERFEPVRKAVYGLIVLIMSAVIVALIALVIKKP